MAVYGRLLAELDANGQHLSEQISEIDLTDPEDARVLMPEQGADILAHFGEDRFLERYQRYKAHIAEWRQQYPKLAAVDLRYDQQVVLQMAQAPPRRGQRPEPRPVRKRRLTPAALSHLPENRLIRPIRSQRWRGSSPPKAIRRIPVSDARLNRNAPLLQKGVASQEVPLRRKARPQRIEQPAIRPPKTS